MDISDPYAMEREFAKKRQAPFIVPSRDDVAKYVADNEYSVDAAHFHDYYSARGWKISNKVMRDWRPVVRTWQRRMDTHESVKSIPKPEPIVFTRGLCRDCVSFCDADFTCRRKAPHLTYGTWPNVKPDDWCGDFLRYVEKGEYAT